jgi:hypothetical protein
MKTRNIILTAIAILISVGLNAQNVVAHNTTAFSNLNNGNKKKPVSTKMQKGQIKDLTLFLFKGNTYTFEINPHRKIKDVNFIILNEKNEIIFNNAIANNCNSAIIFADETQRITIRLTTQPPSFLESDKKYYEVQIKVFQKRENIAR